MNRLMKLFARLYPSSWRNRYEAEFTTLLEDVNPSWRTSVDILKGAIAMQLRTASFGKIVAIMGLIGLLLGLGAWAVIPDQYTSKAVIKIQSLAAHGPLPNSVVSDQMNVWAKVIFTNQSLGELIERFRLYPDKQGKVPLEDIVTGMKNDIEVRPLDKDTLFIQFRYVDRPLSQRVVDDLANRFVDLSRDISAKDKPFNLGILDSASLPDRPVSPNATKLAFFGLLAGIALGLCVAVLHRSVKRA